ncbi:MAG TPA: hypothetical protein VJ810_04730 [Blastocatellia bacterium]|nr:hypothetical protein [Blastocatellia bacterium]
MSRAKQGLILAIIATAVIAGRALPIDLTSTSFVQANQVNLVNARTFEYCAITNAFAEGDNFNRRGKAVIRYFRHGGVREEVVEFVPGIGDRKFDLKDEALAKAITKLGFERWEMVSKEPDTDGKFKPFYFKRSFDPH